MFDFLIVIGSVVDVILSEIDVSVSSCCLFFFAPSVHLSFFFPIDYVCMNPL